MNLSREQRDARWDEIVRLRRAGTTYDEIAAIFGVGTKTISVWYLTEAARRNARAKREAQNASCLCCRRPFGSEGSHNRLCDGCRGMSVSPMAPNPGGSTGRRVGVSK